MQTLNGDRDNRILVVDDNEATHEGFDKTRGPEAASTGEVEALAATHALQGQVAFELGRKAVKEGASFALAFVDVRMPADRKTG